jgi:hypothetical protein
MYISIGCLCSSKERAFLWAHINYCTLPKNIGAFYKTRITFLFFIVLPIPETHFAFWRRGVFSLPQNGIMKRNVCVFLLENACVLLCGFVERKKRLPEQTKQIGIGRRKFLEYKRNMNGVCSKSIVFGC